MAEKVDEVTGERTRGRRRRARCLRIESTRADMENTMMHGLDLASDPQENPEYTQQKIPKPKPTEVKGGMERSQELYIHVWFNYSWVDPRRLELKQRVPQPMTRKFKSKQTRTMVL